jgi:hypothetical protein
MHIFVQYTQPWVDGDAVGEQLSPATQEPTKSPANAVVLATGIRKTSGSW